MKFTRNVYIEYDYGIAVCGRVDNTTQTFTTKLEEDRVALKGSKEKPIFIIYTGADIFGIRLPCVVYQENSAIVNIDWKERNINMIHMWDYRQAPNAPSGIIKSNLPFPSLLHGKGTLEVYLLALSGMKGKDAIKISNEVHIPLEIKLDKEEDLSE